jgi:hypothetical protein
MKFLPTNTLAYFNAAPQVHSNDLSNIPVSVFSAATKKYRESCGLSHPHNDALVFYALNHCASVIRKSYTPNEPLPAWAVTVLNLYTQELSSQGLRMLHYILSITTREMRHLPTPSTQFWAKVEEKFGTPAKEFLQSIRSVSEMAAVERYMSHPPSCTVGQYIGMMSHGFYKGGFGGSFGGPKWGNIADAAASMLTGQTSMEMLVDTGYTLAHNGGPIFNKGMMYHGHNHTLLTILDVQRSGQIPDLLLDTGNFGVEKQDVAKQAVALTHEAKPMGLAQGFKAYVDWKAVKAGAVGYHGQYDEYINKQKKTVPPTAQQLKKLEKVLHGKKVKITGTWMVAPGQSVEVFERV